MCYSIFFSHGFIIHEFIWIPLLSERIEISVAVPLDSVEAQCDSLHFVKQMNLVFVLSDILFVTSSGKGRTVEMCMLLHFEF